MKSKELKKKYLDFFKSKGHATVDSAPLIPENDPTVLFTTAGMQPMVPFFLEQEHPMGKRVVNVQKCIRTGDIDEVGDANHHTYFEMLGNWSFGDYFKKKAIEMTFEFHTKILKIPLERYAVTCFAGNKNAPKDEEAATVWKSLGISEKRIAFLPDNWWETAAPGPCGPDTEMFYWTPNNIPAPEVYDPTDERWVEIGNDVLIEYNKGSNGKYVPLKKKSIDFGGGVERTLAVLNGLDDSYKTELFWPIIEEIEKLTKKKYEFKKEDLGFDEMPQCWLKDMQSMRIVADHMRASVFILGDERGVVPSNVDQGYILRRFIRRSVRHLKSLGMPVEKINLTPIAKKIISMYQDDYSTLKEKKDFILTELEKEQQKFLRTLEKGLNKFNKLSGKDISGQDAFLLFQSFGFPIEMTEELAGEKKIKVDVKSFQKEFEKHQQLSRVGAEKKFKGGLSDASEQTTKLHTATHLLNEALKKILKQDIRQKGSNINPERLRFDFNFDRKLTPEELQAVEDEVNKKIKEALPVKREEMPLQKALDSGAQGEFGTKYPEKVSVYTVGNDYSKEICMGPHIKNTSELSHFRIKKEQSVAAGVRRIKAVLE